MTPYEDINLIKKRTFENSQSKHETSFVQLINIFNQHLTVDTATKWFYTQSLM